MLLLEKEPKLAQHQTGHNSGVIHSGIYYRPGSLKARLCIEGGQRLLAFCAQAGIPTLRCGKIIVATSEEELPRLKELYSRGQANGVKPLSLIQASQIKELEPQVSGLQALHLPEIRIVDYQKVAHAFAEEFQKAGGVIQTSTCLLRIVRDSAQIILETSQGAFRSRCLINCSGLYSDRLSRQKGMPRKIQIVPFRGEYYELIPSRRDWVRGLIYPVPDPQLPFLGVHFTPTLGGQIEVGPNAVLALKREGYRKGDFDLRDCAELISFPGFWRMSGRYWKSGLTEWIRSIYKPAFVREARRLIPALEGKDLTPAMTGVRAQALEQNGNLFDDFCILEEPNLIHVVNAPSPAATACLAIGEWVAQKIQARL